MSKYDPDYHRAYYQRNRERKLAQYRAWYVLNRDRLLARRRAYYLATRESLAERRRAANRKSSLRLRREVLAAYGGRCQCCGVAEEKFLAIDHVYNNGAEHRRSLGGLRGVPFYRWLKKNAYPAGFQVLCHNCNSAKGFYGHCPHLDHPAMVEVGSMVSVAHVV